MIFPQSGNLSDVKERATAYVKTFRSDKGTISERAILLKIHPNITGKPAHTNAEVDQQSCNTQRK